MAALWSLPRPLDLPAALGPGASGSCQARASSPPEVLEAEEDLPGLAALARPHSGRASPSNSRPPGSFAGTFASLCLRHFAEPLRERHLQLWAEVLPMLERSPSQGLPSLLGALASSDAFRDFFAGPRRQPCLLPRLPFAAELPGLREVARGLSSASWPAGACPYSSALFVYDGRHTKAAMPLPSVDSEDLLRQCIRYGTVMVMHSGNHWRRLGNLALASVEHLQVPSNNTIFLTDGGREHSLNLHTDNHNVLILQALGSKRWKVWNPPARARGPDPLARGKHHDSIDPEELGEAILDVDLLPGQALLVPMGFPHVTDTLGSPGEPSLHVTLSMYPTPTFAGLRRELLARLGAPEVVPDEDLSDDVYWRLTRFLPVGFLTPRAVREAPAPGRALAGAVARELCELVSAAEPHRFRAEDPELSAAALEVAAANLRGLLQTLEAYLHGFRAVARAEGDFPSQPPRALAEAFGCGAPPRERRRADPEDGVVRTKAEVIERYRRSYDAEAIEAYWRNCCRPVVSAADGEPARLDPADGAYRTLGDLRQMHRFRWTAEEIEDYWRDCCRPLHEGDELPPEYVERADRAAEDTRELLALLEERMPQLKSIEASPGSDRYELVDRLIPNWGPSKFATAPCAEASSQV